MASKVTKKVIKKSDIVGGIDMGTVRKRTGSSLKRGSSVHMPLGTAIWLLRNTSLTFEQIANFCEMSVMEISAIENGTFADSVMPVNPIGKCITKEEIDRCQKDPSASLVAAEDCIAGTNVVIPKVRKYTPLLQRRNKPDAILWIVTFMPELSNKQIVKLIGTTESTVESIRNRSHRSISSLTPKDPVIVGLCSRRDFENAVAEAKERLRIVEEMKRSHQNN